MPPVPLPYRRHEPCYTMSSPRCRHSLSQRLATPIDPTPRIRHAPEHQESANQMFVQMAKVYTLAAIPPCSSSALCYSQSKYYRLARGLRRSLLQTMDNAPGRSIQRIWLQTFGQSVGSHHYANDGPHWPQSMETQKRLQTSHWQTASETV